MTTSTISNTKTKTDNEHLGCMIFSLMIPFLMGYCIMQIVILVYAFTHNPVLPEFSVVSASVSNTNSTATWDVEFLVHNPNKATPLIYEDFKGALSYKESPVTDIILPNFSQGEMNQTTVKAMFQDTEDSFHASRVVEEEIHGGMLKFNLRMSGMIVVKTSSLHRHWTGSIVCQNLVFQFSGNTSSTLLGGTYDCLLVE